MTTASPAPRRGTSTGGLQITTSLTGNLVEDPTLRFTPAGHAVTNLRVAVTHRTEDRSTGQWRDGDTTYLTVTAWRRLAENTAESLHKGDQVIIIGRLQQRTYQTDTGEKRATHEIEADTIGAALNNAIATLTRNNRPDRPGTEGSSSTPHR